MINHLQEARQAKGYDSPSYLKRLKMDKVHIQTRAQTHSNTNGTGQAFYGVQQSSNIYCGLKIGTSRHNAFIQVTWTSNLRCEDTRTHICVCSFDGQLLSQSRWIAQPVHTEPGDGLTACLGLGLPCRLELPPDQTVRQAVSDITTTGKYRNNFYSLQSLQFIHWHASR